MESVVIIMKVCRYDQHAHVVLWFSCLFVYCSKRERERERERRKQNQLHVRVWI